MTFNFNKHAISLAFRFYARVLAFPYDELTHEFQYLFREIEKYCATDIDNTVAVKILDIINFYQGEEMIALQTEYTCMFSSIEDNEPFISLHISDLVPELDNRDLIDQLYESPLLLDLDESPDLVQNVLDYFSSLLDEEDNWAAEEIFEKYLKKSLSALSEKIYKESTLNFYKESAKGLNELVILLD